MAIIRANWRNFFTIAAVFLLSGCYESSDVKIHESGQYQGKRDSAAIMHSDDSLRTALRKRFQTVQTDR